MIHAILCIQKYKPAENLDHSLVPSKLTASILATLDLCNSKILKIIDLAASNQQLPQLAKMAYISADEYVFGVQGLLINITIIVSCCNNDVKIHIRERHKL